MNKNRVFNEQQSNQRFGGPVAEDLYRSLDGRSIVRVDVGRANAGGVEVFLNGTQSSTAVRGFIPNSHKHPAQQLRTGTQADVLINQVVRRNGKTEFVASLRDVVQVRAARRLAKGDTIDGLVARAVAGGLIIDVSVGCIPLAKDETPEAFSGLTAYVPFREAGRRKPSVGDSVTATVVSVNGLTGSIQASIKAHKSKAFWDVAAVGMRIVGVVLNEAVSQNSGSFGWFVDLNGDEGLLHISELDFGQTFEVGESVEVEILSLDSDSRRIGLGLANAPVRNSSFAEASRQPAGRGQEQRERNHQRTSKGLRRESDGRDRFTAGRRFYEERNYQDYLPKDAGRALSTIGDAMRSAGIRPDDFN